MKVVFNTLLLSVIVILANRLFYLTPWAYVPYVFDTADVGLVLLWAVFGIALLTTRLAILRNSLSLLVTLFIFFIGVQVTLASLYYEQSLLDGLIAARQQFYYASFFVFVLLLDDNKKIVQLLNFLSFVALIVFALALVNYFGHQIIYNSNSEDMRGGIRRIYIPGFPLITLVCLWQIARWFSKERRTWFAGILALIFLGAVFFNMRRGTIIGLSVAVIALLVVQKRYLTLLGAGVAGAILIITASVVLKENLLLLPFTSAAEDIQNESGTWKARLDQIAVDFEEFNKHPIAGSGLLAIRLSTFHGGVMQREEMAAIAYSSDLGYTHWIKNYGLLGVFWMLAYFWKLWKMAWRNQKIKSSDGHSIRLFGFIYVVFMLVSEVTLGHFMNMDRFLLMCLVSAILVRQEQFRQLKNPTAKPHTRLLPGKAI